MMKVEHHFLVGVVLSLVLFPFFGFLSFWALLSSVFIDFDHYLFFIFKKRDLDPFKAFRFYGSRKCGPPGLFIFHTVEFLLILGILAFFSDVFLVLFIGAFVHLFVDFFDGFVWFTYYSGRVTSIFLYPLIQFKGRKVMKTIRDLGGKCVFCGFDKAWEAHYIPGHGLVMLCPNHHYMVHRGLIHDKDLVKLDKRRKR